jgi:surface antigen
MRGLSLLKRILPVAAVLGGALIAAVPAYTYGEPPPWAPAHGWRKKNDPYYYGYTGKRWDNDYGVASGNCNREAIGTVVGGVIGGAVGAQVGKGENRKVAILLGTVAGALIGAQIGRDMDQADRACIGHSLELAGPNKRISWQGADKRTSYLLTPGKGFKHDGQECREFSLRASAGGNRETTVGKACRSGDGTWQILG